MESKNQKRLEDKLDRLDTRLDSIDITLVSQHGSLKEHIRRTELLEAQIEPIKKHVAMIQGALKFVGLIALFAGILEAFLHLLGK